MFYMPSLLVVYAFQLIYMPQHRMLENGRIPFRGVSFSYSIATVIFTLFAELWYSYVIGEINLALCVAGHLQYYAMHDRFGTRSVI